MMKCSATYFYHDVKEIKKKRKPPVKNATQNAFCGNIKNKKKKINKKSNKIVRNTNEYYNALYSVVLLCLIIMASRILNQ